MAEYDNLGIHTEQEESEEIETSLNIQDLPSEILTKICLNFSVFEFCQLRLTCRRFYDLINEVIGLAFSIEDYYPDPDVKEKCEPLENLHRIFELGVSTCKVQTFLDDFKLKFKYPSIMKSIYFNGLISLPNFSSIVLPLSGLQNMTLTFPALSAVTLDLTEETITEYFSTCILQTLTISCSKFKKFLIRSHITTKEALQSGRISRYIDNVIVILTTIKSPRLNSLRISCPLKTDREGQLTCCILECVSRNWTSIRKLALYWECPPEPPVYVAPTTPPVKYDWTNFHGRLLTKFTFFSCEHNRLLWEEEWIRLIKAQRHLAELHYMNRYLEPGKLYNIQQENTLSHGFWNLKIVSILLAAPHPSHRDFPIGSFDCSTFPHSHALTHLFFRGELRHHHDGISQPRLYNLNQIPGKKLEAFSVRGVRINSLEFEALIEWASSLKQLRLHDVGNTGDDGITLTILLKFFENASRLERTEFFKSVNFGDLEDCKALSNLYFKLKKLARLDGFMTTTGNGKRKCLKAFAEIYEHWTIPRVDDETERGEEICQLMW